MLTNSIGAVMTKTLVFQQKLVLLSHKRDLRLGKLFCLETNLHTKWNSNQSVPACSKTTFHSLALLLQSMWEV